MRASRPTRLPPSRRRADHRSAANQGFVPENGRTSNARPYAWCRPPPQGQLSAARLSFSGPGSVTAVGAHHDAPSPSLPPAGEGGSRRSPARRMTDEGEGKTTSDGCSVHFLPHLSAALTSSPAGGGTVWTLRHRRRGRRPRRPVHAKAYPARTVRRIRSLYEFACSFFLFIPCAAGTSGGRPLRR